MPASFYWFLILSYVRQNFKSLKLKKKQSKNSYKNGPVAQHGRAAEEAAEAFKLHAGKALIR